MAKRLKYFLFDILFFSFSAPEILTMQAYSHSADWWSLGILMYALLVGEVSILD